jgi:hypothetical protein
MGEAAPTNGFRVLGYHNKNPKVLKFLPNIVNI